MSLVVLLRGVNVGGHRRFRPTTLAAQLGDLDTVNIGAAGTLVVRGTIARSRLRAEISRRLPFQTEIVIVDGRDILRLQSCRPFAGLRTSKNVIRFVSVLAGRPRKTPRLPLSLPSEGRWLVRLMGRDGQLVYGLHRRQMRAIGSLGSLGQLFGVPATTRSWSTLEAVARVLGARVVPSSPAPGRLQ